MPTGIISLTNIGNGLSANDGTGDTLRTGADKINSNNAAIATVVNNLAAWVGKINGWPDPFFRRAIVGTDFLGRQRWRSNGNNGFASLANAPGTQFDGTALRKTGGGTLNQCGPLLWFDDIGAGPGDTVTIYALVSGSVGNDAYLTGRFYTAANAPTGGGIAGTDVTAVKDAGTTGVILTASPQRLRITAVIPPAGAAIALSPYSSTMGATDTFDIHALWAFKGDQTKGPAWPAVDDSAWLNASDASLSSRLTTDEATLAANSVDITDLKKIKVPQQLAQFKSALTNPLYQHVGVVLIGDSITWGMGATGIESTTPRVGDLTDTRNNGTAATWANLLHAWLGNSYYSDTTMVASAWPGSSGGVAIFEYSKTVSLYPGELPFAYTNSNTVPTVGTWASAVNTSAELGYTLSATVNNSLDNLRLSWRMTGTEFVVVFATLPDGAVYEVLVNGVSAGTFSTQSGDLGLPVQFGNVRTHTLASFARNALIELRVVPGDSTRKILRLEAIRFNRQLRVTNQGVIGTTSYRYTKLLIANALQADDTFALVMLGTNDRAITKGQGYACSPSGLRRSVSELLSQIQAAGVTPILMCANAVTNNSTPTYFYDMGAVRNTLRQLAADSVVDFIDQYAITRPQVQEGSDPTGLLADGTHPTDSGHLLMFNNIKTRIDAA